MKIPKLDTTEVISCICGYHAYYHVGEAGAGETWIASENLALVMTDAVSVINSQPSSKKISKLCFIIVMILLL